MRILWLGAWQAWIQSMVDADWATRVTLIAHETLQEEKWESLEELVVQYDRVIYNSDSCDPTLHALMLAVLCREQDVHFTFFTQCDTSTHDIIPFVLSRMKNVLLLRFPKSPVQKWTTIVLDILQRGYDGEFTLDPTCTRVRTLYAPYFNFVDEQ